MSRPVPHLTEPMRDAAERYARRLIGRHGVSFDLAWGEAKRLALLGMLTADGFKKRVKSKRAKTAKK